ncbi:hypothetical protein AM493_06935 [Flavobacterium akiainvivens]|uniref:NmrA-like domain-containing protein n=1 Tax=Flavobacterium akiainvivens TaxID=1202724 RepID=A0A0M9VHQ0_9FLAO|nr:SDR family oxidoreductase [Flavobacterium akiainvivens]KOS05802.1 hypothetical protein AM493_06935 [Flavobacterium akiainvivens]SFQ57392.1 NAD(P)H dehydrogenase (quinone) [Flavobacterium akiainvivens]
MKLLVTGARGSLGSKVINQLKEKTARENIVAFVRDENAELAKQYAKEGIELKVGDYADVASLENAFKGIDIIYFISGGDDNLRAQLHKNVVDAATKVGVKHIVYTSSMWKDEGAASQLAALVESHLKTEIALKNSGVNYTILKHNLYAEVIEMMIGDKYQLLRSKMIYLPAANGLASFVPKNDLAEAAANILLNPINYISKVLTFNGSEQITFAEVAEQLSGILNEPIKYISPEVDEFKVQLSKFGVPQHAIEILTTFSVAIANGEFDQKSNDLQTVLRRNTTPLSDFLQETYQ